MTMKILVTGGAGFLGSRIITQLLVAKDTGRLTEPIEKIVSLDLAECPVEDPRVDSVVGDLSDKTVIDQLVDAETVGIYHMAAVLSGGSEADFDLAWKVNVTVTQQLLEAVRAIGTQPIFIFTSSLAVFGGEMPEVVEDRLGTQPESTYGATKAIGELMVNEYSRKGYVDARICRLPTISVRPGKPNSAASSFASGIIREPLHGQPSLCPVPLDTKMWLSSPNTAVENLVHAYLIKSQRLGPWRVLNLPGISVTVGQMLQDLEIVGGSQARVLVSEEQNEKIMDIVCSWPGEFDVKRPQQLGFRSDSSFEAAVRQFQEEFIA